MTNRKMKNSGLRDWGYEKGHRDLKIKGPGLARLGVYVEITEPAWQKFKAANPKRSYFIISRGLLSLEFYKKLNRDSRCVNIQISVDLQPKSGPLCKNCYAEQLYPLRNSVARNTVPSCMYFGAKNTTGLVPNLRRINALAKLDKTIFRAKTDKNNAEELYAVLNSAGVADARILETPLRGPKKEERREYEEITPFQIIGQETAKCNSKCSNCSRQTGNAGILYCAVNSYTLERLSNE